MKKFFYLTFCTIFIVKFAIAQSYNHQAEYSIKLVEDRFLFDATLIFNTSSSIFTYKQNEKTSWVIEAKDRPAGQKIFTDTIGYIIYNSFKNNETIVREFCKKNEPMVYQDDVIMNWKLGEKQQKVQGLDCKNAYISFRGRDYEVWYAPSIPTNAGPWKFKGLPGLITKVNDNKGLVSILVKSYSPKSEKAIDKMYLQINTTAQEANENLDNAWKDYYKKNAATIAQLQAEFPDLEISNADLSKTRVATEISLVKK